MSKSNTFNNLSPEARYFSERFQQWFTHHTWKKAALLLSVPYLLLFALFFFFAFRTHHLPPALILIFVFNQERTLADIIYWGAPLNTWPTFWTAILSFLLISLFLLKKSIKTFPFDPKHPFDSAKAWWEYEEKELKKYTYTMGSKDKSVAFAIGSLFFHQLGFILSITTILHSYSPYTTPNLTPADIGLILILSLLINILLVGFVVFVVGFVVVSVVFFFVGVVFFFIVVDFFGAVLGLFGAALGLFGAILGFVVFVVGFVVFVVGFVVFVVGGGVIIDVPFDGYKNEEEWKTVMLYRDAHVLRHPKQSSLSEKAARKEMQSLRLRNVSSVLQHFNYHTFNEFYYVLKRTKHRLKERN